MHVAAPARVALRAIVVEDCDEDAELLLCELDRLGYDVTASRVQTADELRTALQPGTAQLVLSDYSLPRLDAPAALRITRELAPNLPFIIVSGTIGEETAVEALLAGAGDFILKGKLARLGPAIARELREAEGRQQRQQLEQQLQHAQKLESLGHLAGGIAHDFNNVLAAVLGFSELLLGAFEPGDRRADDAMEIYKAGQNGQRLTRQLLAFSRQQTLEPTRVNLNTVVLDLEVMLQHLLGSPVTLETRLSPTLGNVWADTGQLQQVLVNLAVNARDAMPGGGRVRIETSIVPSREGHYGHGGFDEPHVLLRVTDTGSGMGPEVKARIFEPLFTTKAPDKGTGLGLATVYGIVRQSGGIIDVESQLGEGTTFLIFLPLRD